MSPHRLAPAAERPWRGHSRRLLAGPVVAAILLSLFPGAQPARAASGFLVFDAVTDNIRVSGQSLVGTTSTFEAIVRFPSAGNGIGRIFNEWTSSFEDKVLFVGPARITGFKFPNSIRNVVPSPSMSLDVWHHVAVVLGGGTQRTYLDGVQIDSVARTQNVGDGAGLAYIGAIPRESAPTPAPSFIGHLDSFRQSNVARYTGTSFTAPTGDLTSDANTLLLYNFNEPAGSTTVDDESSGNRTGTLGIGFPTATQPTFGSDGLVPSLSINDVSAAEGDDGGTPFVFTAALSAASTQTVTVSYSTADGTATTVDGDYEATSGTLTFNPGDTSKEIPVNVIGDTGVEPDETFAVDLSNPNNATIADAQGSGTIQDDDEAPLPSLGISDTTAPEGTGAPHSFSFDVTLSAASTDTVTVAYTTTDGTATSPEDYATTAGTLTFVPGDQLKSILVPLVTDATQEPDEVFAVNLSSPTNATIADDEGVGTIQNDDVPDVFIGDASVTEGDGGTASLEFAATLDAPYPSTVSADWTTLDGSATSASGDYLAASGTVTFVPADTSETITVLVNGDTEVETDETVQVQLSNFTNAGNGDDLGIGTITNDDAPPPGLVADLAITAFTDTPDPVTTGETLRYTIDVTNNGPDAATNVGLTQTLGGSTFVGSSHSCVEDEGQVMCDLGTLADTGIASVTVDVTAPSTAGALASNVDVSAFEDDPVSANNSASTSTTVQDPATATDQASGFATGDQPTTVATSSSDPVQFSSLTVPTNVEGTVTLSEVAEGAACTLVVVGVTCIGERLDLVAPDATAANPLVLEILVGKATLAKGINAKKLVLYHLPDGGGAYLAVPPCSRKANGTADPAPSCVASIRKVTVNGVVYWRFTVSTADNGSWRPGAR